MNHLLCAEGIAFDRDMKGPGPNDNMVVIGGSGRGKTSSVLDANLMYGGTGSMIISDPKGALFHRYSTFFRRQGYEVAQLDFMHPMSSIGYNPFRFIRNEMDIQALSSILIRSVGTSRVDPFWDESAQTLCHALIGYILMFCDKKDWTFAKLLDLVSQCGESKEIGSPSSADLLAHMKYNTPLRFSELQPTCIRRLQIYDGLCEKTKSCVQATLYAKLASFDVREIHMLMSSNRESIDFRRIADIPYVLFVTVSDMNRSNDILASLFFTQCFSRLCQYADSRPDHQLPWSVRFFLDDFASSVVIKDMPNYLSTIRARRISATMFLQSIAQLRSIYGTSDSEVILDNCDTLVYLGGNDVSTAKWISDRVNRPTESILTMPYGDCLVVRTGEPAQDGKNYPPYENYTSRVEHKIIDISSQKSVTIERKVIGF